MLVLSNDSCTAFAKILGLNASDLTPPLTKNQLDAVHVLRNLENPISGACEALFGFVAQLEGVEVVRAYVNIAFPLIVEAAYEAFNTASFYPNVAFAMADQGLIGIGLNQPRSA